MNIKFKTFTPTYHESAANVLTTWLVEHTYVELICWQANTVGKEVVITIQYEER